jgi:hypothetical protein
MFYRVQANVIVRGANGYVTTYQIPTFHLNKDLLGILSSEGAAEIAKRMLNPSSDTNVEVSAWAFLIEE